jgi:thiosulfate reductase cytochrome b subunit
MKTAHLTDIEIQQYVLNPTDTHPYLLEHMATCESCKAKAANYRLMFSVIREQKKPAFDFDLSALMIEQISPVMPAASWLDKMTYTLILLGVLPLIVVVYENKDYLLAQVPGVSAMLLCLIGVTALTILIFQVIDLNKNHKQKMNILDAI